MDEVKLALEMNKLVHNECKDVPHDIGLKLLEVVKKHVGEQLNLQPVSNALPYFGDVIKARIDYFKSIHHTYEAADLQNALNTIIRLVPPINFQIGQ